MVAVSCSLLVATMAASLAVEAQTAAQVYRIGLIATQTPVAKIVSDPAHPFNSFRREMRDRGYVEGTNFALELRSIEGKIERASGVLDQLLRLNVHVIVTVGVDVTREAKRLTTTVPIVMAPVRLAVEEGLVASLSRPGGNITGLTLDAGAELEGRRLALLKEISPKLRRVAYLGTKADWKSPGGMSARAAAGTLGLDLFLAEFSPNNYGAALGLIVKERADAIIISPSPLHYQYRTLVSEFAARNGLPSMYYFQDFAHAGRLISYGADLRDLYRHAAIYVDRILKGARPADLPVEQPTTHELVINVKTAKILGAHDPAMGARPDR
jgi:putative ABC transport system substrate-binding protein